MTNLNRIEAISQPTSHITLPRPRQSQKSPLTYMTAAIFSGALGVEAADSKTNTLKALLNSVSPWKIVAAGSIVVLTGIFFLRKRFIKPEIKHDSFITTPPQAQPTPPSRNSIVGPLRTSGNPLSLRYQERNRFDPIAMFYKDGTDQLVIEIGTVLKQFPSDELMAMLAFIQQRPALKNFVVKQKAAFGLPSVLLIQQSSSSAQLKGERFFEALMNASLKASTSREKAIVYLAAMMQTPEKTGHWESMIKSSPHVIGNIVKALIYRVSDKDYDPTKLIEYIEPCNNFLRKFGITLDLEEAGESKEADSIPTTQSSSKALALATRKKE